jgi:hypothetical protein
MCMYILYIYILKFLHMCLNIYIYVCQKSVLKIVGDSDKSSIGIFVCIYLYSICMEIFICYILKFLQYIYEYIYMYVCIFMYKYILYIIYIAQRLSLNYCKHHQYIPITGIRNNFDVLGLVLIFEKKGQKPGVTGQIHGFGG